MKKFVAFLFLALIASPALADDMYAKSVLVTNGTGELEVKPDYVNVHANLQSRDKDLQKAKKINDENYAKVLKTLENNGVKKTDIKGNSVSISPVYKTCYDEQGKYKSCDQTIVDYYNVNRSLTIKLTNLEKYDSVLTGLAESGYVNVNSGQFGVTDIAKYKDEVRNLAIDSAKSKAQKIAAKMEVKLKKPLRFEGYDDSVNYPMANVHAFAKAERAMDVAAAPMAPTDTETLGTIKLNSNVTITYEIE